MATMARSEALPANPAHQAYQLLHFAFTVAPIIAGIDKFLHIITDWSMYLAPVVGRIVPLPSGTFMRVAGVIEIIAGLLVAFKPQIGGYVVTLWLWGIIVNLFLVPGFYDIALRDFGLSLGALALARLATVEAARR